LRPGCEVGGIVFPFYVCVFVFEGFVHTEFVLGLYGGSRKGER
jgi:hypothetical protein